ncbi:MAG: hypothetical protein ACTHMG_14185 [Sphingomonas sp.]
MDLLLLLYAVIAGLTGINAGPATAARLPAAAQNAAVAGLEARGEGQAMLAVRALVARRTAVTRRPEAVVPDFRQIAAVMRPILFVSAERATPEQRRE